MAAGTPEIRVADCRYNAEQIFTLMREADKQGVRVLALPELCLTGYTCGDLFLQDTLLKGAEEGLATILEATKNLDMLTALGLPVKNLGRQALQLRGGHPQGGDPGPGAQDLAAQLRGVLRGALVRLRQGAGRLCELCGQQVSLCDQLVWACDTMPDLVVGVEICEDLWASTPPSVALAQAGATVILNLSASDEVVGKADYRRALVTGQSARLVCGYVYADAGEGESTTDLVFAGHNLIAENGALLAERRFASGLTVSEIDVDRLAYERRRMNTFTASQEALEDLPGPLLPGAGHDHPHPARLPHPLCPRGRGGPGGAVRGDPEHRRPGPEKAAGAHPRRGGGGGPVRRAGLHPGHPHHRRGHEAAGPAGQRHHRRHHALLRHHRPHPGQRRGAGRAAGGHPEAHRHRRGGEAATSGTSASPWTTTT